MTPRVAVASVVCHGVAVLAEFLTSLSRLDTAGTELSFLLADDTVDPRSGRLLAEFADADERVSVVQAGPVTSARAEASSPAERRVWQRAERKDLLLEEACRRGATHVLLTDSNLLLPPPLVRHLVSLQRDIVSEVFWSEWQPGAVPLPNVWLSDQYHFFGPELVSAGVKEQSEAANAFIAKLREPGIYPVGGLGGCTLIGRAAMDAGTSLKALPNVGLWGDDRHFSIRAAALGFSLWADTQYPLLHVYREADLGLVEHFWSRWLRKGTEAA